MRRACVVMAALGALAGCKQTPKLELQFAVIDPLEVVVARHAIAEAAIPPDAALPPDVAAPRDAAAPTTTPLEARLLGYARLLAFDFTIAQIVAAYPGTPDGTVFTVSEYDWGFFVVSTGTSHVPLPAKELAALGARLAVPGPAFIGDSDIKAYVDFATAWLPELDRLRTYYEHHDFVEDEFDRGRAAAADFHAAVAKLAALRPAMRVAIELAWSEQLDTQRDAPRAAVGRAWLACMAVADALLAPKVRDPDVNAAVSKCRRSIEPVRAAGLGAAFADPVHQTAVALGDWVASDRPVYKADASATLAALTTKFTALWPTLPQVPAEAPSKP